MNGYLWIPVAIDNGRKGKKDNAISAELNRKMDCGIKRPLM
jgi:hypothetical protein